MSVRAPDRICLRLSSLMAEPFCKLWECKYRLTTPLIAGKFDNASTKTKEVFHRCCIVLGMGTSLFVTIYSPVPVLIFLSILGVGSRLSRALGFCFQKNGFTHVRGRAAEITLTEAPKVMNWNVLGAAGGMTFDHGGVNSWRSRFEGIVQRIEDEDPDILVLEEIYDTELGEALIKRFKDRFAHFYFHCGPSSIGSVGGCMVMTKCSVNRFTHTSFSNNSWILNRGFETIEIKASPQSSSSCLRVIGTHLVHNNREKRLVQFAEIINSLALETLEHLPTIVTGDLNMEYTTEGEALQPYLVHGYQESEPTCTNAFEELWNGKLGDHNASKIDYLSLVRRTTPDGRILHVVEDNITLDCRRVLAFNDETLESQSSALSDHHGLVARIQGLQQIEAIG